ncbi:MAG TPA: hypothetical protein VMU84_00340 [Thermoanaerobaculia bacterium]|nr:hypothetical protein [Thermoanaerobaculia bacterium]
MMDLSLPPPPLTRRERLLFLLVAAMCAATRFLALARSIWDWDEALFCLGMRGYDVTMHHPHPPGFPVYIAMAKIVRLVAPSDFRALQSVNLIAAVLLFPAMFLLARELRWRFKTSLVAALLFSFFPNVWFFGGTAFSDIPSIALVIFACAMLLRGVRSRNAYWIGTLLLALAIGMRPQNLLVGLWPGLVATIKRKPREIIVALLIGVVICSVAYGAASYATGSFDKYLDTVRGHGEYISRTDSFRNPDRPPLWRMADRFFLKQYQSPVLSAITSLFAIVSLVGAIKTRDRRVLYVLLMFLPFAIMAWLMLDRFSISRFSIGYQPMFALLAADGIARASERRAWLEPALGFALAFAFASYTIPTLGPVRNELSPPVRAIDAVQRHLDPKRQELFVAYGMVPFVEYLAPSVHFTRVLDDRAMPFTAKRDAWLIAEASEGKSSGFFFERDRGRLWNIARRHYFEITLKPLRELPQFVSGWYEGERSGMDEWRWMSDHSVTLLPPARGRTVLRVQFGVPVETLPSHPVVSFVLNGHVVGRVRVDEANMSRDFDVTSAVNGSTNTLEIVVDRAVRPPNDGRVLGAQVRFLSFGPG